MPEIEGIGRLMELDEVAESFHVSVWTIRRWCTLRNGKRKLGHFRVGKRMMFSSVEVERVLRMGEVKQV